MSNLSWGMQFRTCEKFWESADFSPALSQNFSQIQKPHRHYFDCLLHNFVILSRRRRISKRNLIRFCESQNLGENSEKNAESAIDSAFPQNLVKKSNKKPLKSFCYFLLSQKVESLIPSNLNPPSEADSQNLTLDSANQNNPSLRDSARNAQNRGACCVSNSPTLANPH